MIQGPSPGVTALDRFAMSISELGAFQGQFQLVDGRTLSVTRRNRTLFAELIGQPPVELVPKSGNTFVSVKGAIHLKFQQAQNGNVSGVEMRSVGRTG